MKMERIYKYDFILQVSSALFGNGSLILKNQILSFQGWAQLTLNILFCFFLEDVECLGFLEKVRRQQ
jgi:hypothetical protein